MALKLNLCTSFDYKSLPCRIPALTWSDDLKFILCLEEGIYILRLNTQTFNSRIEQSFSMKSFLLSYSEIDQPFSIPVSRPEAITQAMNENFINIHIDRTLNPNVVTAPSRKYFYIARPSAKGVDKYGSCVMASLTLDHHLSVWICVAQKSWSSVIDLSKRLNEMALETAWKHVKRESYAINKYYKDSLYSLSATNMCWSDRVHSSADGEKFTCLVTSMKDGNLVCWRITVPLTDSSSFADAVRWELPDNRSEASHIMLLSTSNCKEWLIVSFVDGSVSSYPVLHGIGDISLGEPCVLWKGDRITCTNMVYNNQRKILCLSKQGYIVIMHLGVTNNELNVVSLHYEMLSATSKIIDIKFLEYDIYTITASNRLYILTANLDGFAVISKECTVPEFKDYQNCGMVITKNKLLFMIYKHVYCGNQVLQQTPLKLAMLTMKPYESYIDDLCSLSKADTACRLYDYHDILHYVLHKSYEDRSINTKLLDFIQNDNYEEMNTLKLKIYRFVLKIQATYCTSDRDESVDKAKMVDARLQKVSEHLVFHRVRLVLRTLLVNKDLLNEQEKQCVSVLCSRLMNSFTHRHSDVLLVKSVQKMYNISTNQPQTCFICKQNLDVNLNNCQCPKKHLFPMCILTLQPCTNMRVMSCPTCHTVCQNKETTCGRWVQKVLSAGCPYCDSLMESKT